MVFFVSLGNSLYNNHFVSLMSSGVVGLSAGYMSESLSSVIQFRCNDGSSLLRNYHLCPSMHMFAKPVNLERLNNIIAEANLWFAEKISPIVQMIDSFNSQSGRNYDAYFSNAAEKAQKIADKYLPIFGGMGNDIDSGLHSIPRNLVEGEKARLFDLQKAIVHSKLLSERCSLQNQIGRILSSSFFEEVMFRQIIQKTIPLGVAKLLPKRVQKVISHPLPRVFVASLIFSLAHYDGRDDHKVVARFLTGVIFGVVSEKFGLLSSTLAHATANLIVDRSVVQMCKDSIPAFESFFEALPL